MRCLSAWKLSSIILATQQTGAHRFLMDERSDSGSLIEGVFVRGTRPLIYVARLWKLFAETCYWIVVVGLRSPRRLRRAETFRQMVQAGINSIPILFLIIFLIGFILAMQSAYQLKKFGVTSLVAPLVGVTITREVGPLITAIIISARVGAAITAELGTMAVSEEIMALETMAIRPVPFLVVPRFIALVVMLPCLTMLADLVGLLGGFCVGVGNLDMSAGAYFHNTIEGLENQDIITGLVKSVGFAVVIALVSCHEGLSVGGGPEGVGTATTRSVVTSILLIILTDLMFTVIFYL